MSSYENAINLVGHYFLGYEKEHIPKCWNISISIIYAIIFVVIGAWTLYRISIKSIKHEKSTENISEITKRIIKTQKRNKILRIIRSLGVVLLYEYLLSKQDVIYYDHFNRPNDWEKQTKMLDRIDRYICKDDSIEFQYSRDYLYIQHRLGTGDENRKYGDPKETIWKDTPKRYLILFSRTGFIWSIRHWWKCFIKKFSKI